MTRTESVQVADHTDRIAIAKPFAWTRKRATQPASRPAATGGTR